MNPVEIISASAGTGKTTRLADVIAEAIESEDSRPAARPEAVLATTFTNRAAAELAERAREHLLRRNHVDEAHRLQAARIGTVNGVCGRIVQDFAFAHGLAPRVSVLDETLAKQEILRASAQTLPRDLIEDLDEIAARFPGLEWQTDARRIVELARTNAISAELLPSLAERSADSLCDLLGAPADDEAPLDAALDVALVDFLEQVDLEVDTTATTRKARETAQMARQRGSRALSWSDWLGLAQLAPAKKSKPIAEPVREAAMAHDRHPRLHADLRRLIAAVFRAASYMLDAYQVHKRRLGVIDFVDQEAYALKLLQDEPVREQLRDEIDLVLVDEFQDTSPIQLAIFLELAKVAPRSVWVGDPKQAIYGFRGADPALMDAAVGALLHGNPPATLALCYRSRPALVRLTSRLFAPAFAEAGIPEVLVRVEPGNETEPDGLGTILERWILEGDEVPETGKRRQNQQTDLASLAAGVKAILGDPEAKVRDRATGDVRDLEAGDVAVLCFKHVQCVGLARELEARGVRAVVGRPGLARTLEARMAMAALRLWIDPEDALARAELGRWLVHTQDGERWLARVLESEEKAALFSELPPVESLRLEREPRAFAGVLAAFDAALSAAGIRERVVAFGDATARLANLDALRARVAAYVDVCRGEGMPCTLRGLLVHLEQLATDKLDQQAASERPDAVRICTWHAAKGLEWPVTVLADLSNAPKPSPLGVQIVAERDVLDLEDPLGGRWLRYWPDPYAPRKKGAQFHDRLEEHPSMIQAQESARREALRLLYVGWTRARDRIVLAGRADRLEKGRFSVMAAGGAPILAEPGEDGVAHWGPSHASEPVSLRIRTLAPVDDSRPARRPAHGYEPAGRREHPAAKRSPSHEEGVGHVGEIHEIGKRIPLNVRDDEEMRNLGDAVHAFLAADRDELDAPTRENLARRCLQRFEVPSAIDPGELALAGRVLSKWVDSRWPDARWQREWPLLQRLPDGTVVSGRCDLVLETSNGLVLIDHKTFPGNREQAAERAGKYAGQLSAYASALQVATGKPLRSAIIHLPISGTAISVTVP